MVKTFSVLIILILPQPHIIVADNSRPPARSSTNNAILICRRLVVKIVEQLEVSQNNSHTKQGKIASSKYAEQKSNIVTMPNHSKSGTKVQLFVWDPLQESEHPESKSPDGGRRLEQLQEESFVGFEGVHFLNGGQEHAIAYSPFYLVNAGRELFFRLKPKVDMHALLLKLRAQNAAAAAARDITKATDTLATTHNKVNPDTNLTSINSLSVNSSNPVKPPNGGKKAKTNKRNYTEQFSNFDLMLTAVAKNVNSANRSIGSRSDKVKEKLIRKQNDIPITKPVAGPLPIKLQVDVSRRPSWILL